MSNGRSGSLLSLFASASTLICCALPALFVSLGAGAAFASLVGTFPFLVTLSRYKVEITLIALATLILGGGIQYLTARMPCPADPEIGRLCMRTRARSRLLYYIALAIFAFATVFSYLVPELL